MQTLTEVMLLRKTSAESGKGAVSEGSSIRGGVLVEGESEDVGGMGISRV